MGNAATNGELLAMMKHVCIALVVTLFGLPLWATAQTRPFDVRGTSGPRGFGDAKPRRNVASAGDAIALLRKRVDKVDWEEMPFEEVLDWLREEGDNRVNVLPRWLALNNDGVDEESLVTLRLTNSMVAEVLNDRLSRGQISDGQKDEILHAYIRDQVADIDRALIPADQVWRFADVYRQMEDWEATFDLYTIAVMNAESEDRRVNDSLRLAEATARLGDIEEGINLVRSTFDVDPLGKAPILMATLFETPKVGRYRAASTGLYSMRKGWRFHG